MVAGDTRTPKSKTNWSSLFLSLGGFRGLWPKPHTARGLSRRSGLRGEGEGLASCRLHYLRLTRPCMNPQAGTCVRVPQDSPCVHGVRPCMVWGARTGRLLAVCASASASDAHRLLHVRPRLESMHQCYAGTWASAVRRPHRLAITDVSSEAMEGVISSISAFQMNVDKTAYEQ